LGKYNELEKPISVNFSTIELIFNTCYVTISLFVKHLAGDSTEASEL